MSSISRNYKISDVKRLFSLCGNQCAEPTCTNKIIADDGITVLGEICHISAANKFGPRYNSLLNDDERRSFENLILLCPEHHKIIDNSANELKYSVDTLNLWKSNHINKFNAFPVNTKLAENAIKKINFQPVISIENVINVSGVNNSLNEDNLKVDEFLIENLKNYRKGQFFDIYMYGLSFIFAVLIFGYLIWDYQKQTGPFNPINVLRIIPVLPVKFCVGSWKMARNKLRESKMIETKYKKWIKASPTRELLPNQHIVLSEKFDKIREIK